MAMENIPDGISICKIECILMPNGEVITAGKSIGWFDQLKKYMEFVSKGA